MNINKLIQGKPIILRSILHGKEILPSGWEICITFGETEEDIVKEMKDGGFVTGATEVVDARTGRGGQRN